MGTEEFLELCVGKWFSLRTGYRLDNTKVDNSKSEITIERLLSDRSEVITLCQQHQIDPNDTLGGTKALWEEPADGFKPKQIGSATIVLVPDRDNSRTGKLLSALGNTSSSTVGRYVLGNDEALTLIIEGEKIYSEERLWFASPNLRLRTSLSKSSHGLSRSAFYSEIRRVVKKDNE
jgi:phycoerythrin-associated linker protein